MKRGRLWFPLDVDFWSDPDVIAIGESSAVLFQKLIGYAKRHQTDGAVPINVVKSIGGRRWASKIAPLIDRGMVTCGANTAPDCGHDEPRGGHKTGPIAGAKWCHVVAFLAWNDSSDDIEQRREIARKKKNRQRRAMANVPGGQPGSVPAPVPAMSPSQETEEEIDTPPDGGVTRAPERTSARELDEPDPIPPKPDRSKPDPRDPLSFEGELAEAALRAHSEACVAAGGIPRARVGYAAMSAYRHAAAKAQALSQALREPVPVLLEQSARGFVAQRGSGARAEWWVENFEGYLEAARGGPSLAKTKGMVPEGTDWRDDAPDDPEELFR